MESDDCQLDNETIVQSLLNSITLNIAAIIELPKKRIGECWEYWKSSGASCWASYEWLDASWMYDPQYANEFPYLELWTPAPPPYFLEIFMPCNNAHCCYQKVKICYTGENQYGQDTYTQDNIGEPFLAEDDCSYAQLMELEGIFPEPDNNPACYPMCIALLYYSRTGDFQIEQDYPQILDNLDCSNKDGILKIYYNTTENKQLTFQVYNIFGELVEQIQAEACKGNNTFEINLQFLPSGEYFLLTNTLESNFFAKKFLVLN